MAKFCGGFIPDNKTLKMIKGIICDANASTADKSKAVTTCGQLWDSSLFVVTTVNGRKVVTLHSTEGEDIGKPIFASASCCVGVDSRFFKITGRILSLQDGFVLTVNVTPADATIKVTDADSTEVSPISGTTNTFLLSGLGDSYTVTVSKTGYTTQTKTVKNTGDQTIAVTLVEAAGD